MEYSLNLKQVTKQYPNFLLDQITFRIPKGSIMGLIGVNGAGKSTTMKCILNMLEIDDGNIEILGKQNDDETIRQELGVVFDECNFPQSFMVKQIDLIMKNIYQKWDSKQFFAYLDQFHIPANKTIKEFSRGMKVKLNIAIALSHKAKLLILDEPTSGLDPIIRNEILDVLLDFIQDEENAVLISSHITSDLEKIADYVTFIDHGKVIFSSNKDELLYQHGVIKGSEEQIETISNEFIIAKRKGRFDTEALIRQKDVFQQKYPHIVLDNSNLEDFMVFLTQK